MSALNDLVLEKLQNEMTQFKLLFHVLVFWTWFGFIHTKMFLYPLWARVNVFSDDVTFSYSVNPFKYDFYNY